MPSTKDGQQGRQHCLPSCSQVHPSESAVTVPYHVYMVGHRIRMRATVGNAALHIRMQQSVAKADSFRLQVGLWSRSEVQSLKHKLVMSTGNCR